jgi:hypothetical protein
MSQKDSSNFSLDTLTNSVKSGDFDTFINLIQDNIHNLNEIHFEFIIEQIPLTTEFIAENKNICLEIVKLVNENNFNFKNSQTNMKFGLIEVVLNDNDL